MNVLRALPFLILACAALWYGALVMRFPTHGAIGADPATYVQMARDLATRGTVVHEFSLFTKLYTQNLSWDAFIPPGYHIVPETGFVAPNFAFGFPLLLAFAYRTFGESALYWLTPLMGALALVMTFALANELFRDLSQTRRYWIGALAVLLLATTPKQIQLALVPMSDVPTQLFCVLALWCALRAVRPDSFSKPVRSVALAAFCGLSLGMAYLVRHSALALAAPLAMVALRWGATRREKFFLIAVALFVFAITIAPDIFYHAQALGSAFAVESPESAQTNFYDAPRQIWETFAALFSVTGFGPAIALAPIGWWILAREKNMFAARVLAAWILAFIFLHAPLKLTGVFENSLRYLLPAYPAIALSASVALIWICERAWNEMRAARTRFAKPALLAYVGALCGIFALAIALRALVGPERFAARAYGWLSETARADLETLNAQLPRDAVIGVSDQMAGATLLYAQREIFRPNNFLEPAREFPQFLEMMQKEKRAAYVLGDWNCAGDASEKLPQWLERYATLVPRSPIRALPYACAQKVWSVERN